MKAYVWALMILAALAAPVLAQDVAPPVEAAPAYPEWLFPAIAAILALIGAGMITKIRSLIKETRELLAAISDAISDMKVDDAEVARILKEFAETKTAVKKVLQGFKSVFTKKT